VSGDCAVHRNALNVEPHLTFREHQILELVAVGWSAKQIALEISIAPRTVERHIENVRLKLNARNRAHLITQAMHLGLLVIETPTPDEPTLFEFK
jgi:DNA-binding NarL/FixJ family response regulator